jgi:integrase
MDSNATTNSSRPRRGWRERLAAAFYRAHSVSCHSTADRRPGRRCGCAFEFQVPGPTPGRSRTVTFRGTITEARAEHRLLLAANRVEAAAPRVVDGETLDEFAGYYLRTRAAVLKPHTIETTAREYRLRVSPAFGHLGLAEITREQVEGWVADLVGQSLSRRLVVGAVAALRVVLSAAVKWGRITTNPAMGIDLPIEQTDRYQAAERVLDADQVRALLAACSGSLRVETMVRAAVEGGLRRGEIAGLCWDDIDLAARRIRVRRSISEIAGEKLEQPTKGRRARSVPISDGFALRLGDLRTGIAHGGDSPAGRFVWPGQSGGPMGAGSFNQALRRALDRAGLVDADGVPLVTPHRLRHTAGSLMLGASVPLIVVSRVLGHRDPRITAEIYAHLLGDWQLDEVGGVFDSLGFADTMGDVMGETRGSPLARLHR